MTPCWQAELSSFTCSIAFSKLFPVVMGITATEELTSACMNVVTSFAVLYMEPATKLLLTIVSTTLCNYMVVEVLPVLPCLSEVVCNWVRDKFPASKCEGLRHHRQFYLHIKPKVRCIIRLEDHCLRIRKDAAIFSTRYGSSDQLSFFYGIDFGLTKSQ